MSKKRAVETVTMKRVAFYGVMAFMGGAVAQAVMGVSLVQNAQAGPADRQVVSNRMYIVTPDGRMRIQAGTYDQAGENGLPVIALSDNRDQIRMLFRLAGTNESPVLVMKDKSGADRLVMGLKMTGTSEEPFLQIVDDRGVRREVLDRLR